MTNKLNKMRPLLMGFIIVLSIIITIFISQFCKEIVHKSGFLNITFVVGTWAGPDDVDPVHSWDKNSFFH